MANLRDKTDRAVAAFIKQAVQGVSGLIPIYPSNWSGPRDQTGGPGLVDVITTQGPEDPPFSGNYWMDLKIRVQMPAVNQPNQSDIRAARVQLGKIVDAIFDLMHQTDNSSDYQYTARAITAAGNALTADASAGTNKDETQRALDDADMAAFTCLDLRGSHYLGAPDEGEKSLSFVEIMKQQIYVAAQGGLN